MRRVLGREGRHLRGQVRHLRREDGRAARPERGPANRTVRLKPRPEPEEEPARKRNRKANGRIHFELRAEQHFVRRRSKI